MQSQFVILYDRNGIRLSANIDYISYPDIILIKSNSYNFSWSVGEDPLGSDHLPIEIIIKYKNESNSSSNSTSNHPKISLNHLNKKLFQALVSQHMFHLHLELEGNQLYDDKWYTTIIECSLKAGGVITEQNGLCKKFDIKKERIVSYCYKKIKL